MRHIRLESVDSETFRSSPTLMGILAQSIYQPAEERMHHILQSTYGQAGTALFALCAVDRCVAVAGTRRIGDRSAELLHIAVVPTRRGEGFGRLLIDLLMQEQGLREMVAETDIDAVGFYRNCEFSIASLGEKYPGAERFLCTRSAE